MSTPAGTRIRLALKTSGVLTAIGTAVVLALAFALFTLGSQPASLVASAELAAGAALQAQSGWVLPAVFSVLVFTGVVLMTVLLGKPSVDVTWTPAAPYLRAVPQPPLAHGHATSDRAGQLVATTQS